MNEPPLPPPPSPMNSRPRGHVWLAGMVLANLLMGTLFGALVGLIALARRLQENGHDDFWTLIGLPSLFLVPMLGGLAAAYVWRSLRPTFGGIALNSLWLTLMGLAGAAVAFREGVICLLMAFPIFYGCVLAGAAIGRVWFRPADLTRLRLAVLPLLALAVAGEPFLRHDREGVVVDEILIHAPPDRVWPEVTAFPDIPAPPRFWLFRLGLPYPVATTTAGNFVGADRRCIFSGGAVFKETVAECVPGERLTFDIVEAPPDPELLGHLSLHRGQFLLRDNGDGTTTLTGSSWYTLHVRPLGYFDLWTNHIFRAVHLRVMEDVRRRAELPR